MSLNYYQKSFLGNIAKGFVSIAAASALVPFGLSQLQSCGEVNWIKKPKYVFAYFKNETDTTYFPGDNPSNERIFRFSEENITKNICMDADGDMNTIEQFVKLDKNNNVLENYSVGEYISVAEFKNPKKMTEEDSVRIHDEYKTLSKYYLIMKYVDENGVHKGWVPKKDATW